MISKDQIQAVRGGTAVDSDGGKIGGIGEVYLDDRTGEPAWLTVNTGLFGTSESFVPVQEAQVDGDQVRVPYSKDQVKDAPRVDADQHLDVEQERELYRHYGLDYDAAHSGQGQAGTGRGEVAGAGERRADATTAGTTGTAAAGTAAAGTAAAGTAATGRTEAAADTRRPAADTARTDAAPAGADTGGDGVVRRHEEQLNVGTERRDAGTVRLRKYVTEERESVDVPVTREEVRVERRPVEGQAAVVDGDPIGEAEQEVTLHEEVPVVSKETRAVEEVRLSTEQVQDTERVSDTVRKEHVDVDRDGQPLADGTRKDAGDGRKA